MGREPRVEEPGGTYHVTTRGSNRGAINSLRATASITCTSSEQQR